MNWIWPTMAAAGLITFLIRLSFIGVLHSWQPPRLVERALRFVPPAVLAAIVFPEVLVRSGTFDPWNPRLIAAALAALMAWRTRSAILAIIAGMAALLALQLFWV
jgi:branched-subunit amino acid transport protein